MKLPSSMNATAYHEAFSIHLRRFGNFYVIDGVPSDAALSSVRGTAGTWAALATLQDVCGALVE